MSQEYPDAESQLTALNQDFSSLQSHLETIELQHQRINAYVNAQCSEVLKESLTLLCKLIESVNKADKTLVQWHHQSDGLKTALKLMKLDRRTQQAIDRKNEKIKTDVAKVEQEFNRTQETFDSGLELVHSLNQQFKDFSFQKVQDTSKHATEVYEDSDKEYQRLQQSLPPLQEELTQVEAKSKPIKQRSDNIKWDSQNAAISRTFYGMVSTMSYIAAASTHYGSYLIPYMSHVTNQLNAIGEVNATTATKYEAVVHQLEEEQRELDLRLLDCHRQFDSINQSLNEVNSQSTAHSQAMDRANVIKQSSLGLRLKAQSSLENLRKAKIELSSTREKVKQIATELHESGYGKSRREISGRLREALHLIMDVGKKRKVVFNEGDISRAMDELLQLDQLTARVVTLIESKPEGPQAREE